MTSKGSFKNQYEDYTADIASHILNVSKDGISDKFQLKLQNFKAAKLHILLTQMKKDIFYDGTVYTGSAGLGLYYLTCAWQKSEVNLDLLKKALDYIDINTLKGRRISFLCGDAGPLALATVISYKFGTKRLESLPEYKTLANRLMSLISLINDSPDELLYGKSGYLYALLFVNKYINGKETIPSSHIEMVIESILKSGKLFSTQMKSESPLLWQWHEKVYFGAAHGMAGILYMLLQARMYINIIEIRSFVKPTLDWLLNHRFSSGNFHSSLGSSSNDRLVQWCHGAPGFVPLCILAHQVFEDDKYLKIALQCGDVIWQRGLCTKGYSMCHGVSGNAYAFIQLYQATKEFTAEKMAGVITITTQMKAITEARQQFRTIIDLIILLYDYNHRDLILYYVQQRINAYTLKMSTVTRAKTAKVKPIHLYRACCFMEWCAVERPGTELHHPDRPASLFEGLVGRLYLAEDFSSDFNSKFPGLCL